MSGVSVSERRERRLMIALALNVLIVVAQVIFGFIGHSLGLLADAGHNLTDVVAIFVSLLAVRWARRRATAQHSFGYHRATILAALANAVSILAVTVFIVYEAVRRLLTPEPVSGGIVVIVALIAAAANLAATLAVRESHAPHGHGSDLNMRSAMLHLIGDTAASIGVAIAGAIILITGGAYWLDPVVSLGIGVLIAYQAWRLLRETIDVLLEATPDGIDVDEVTAAIAGMPGVEQVHDLHVWSLSSEVRALSAHLVMDGHPTLEEAQAVAATVKQAITPRFGIAHATFELECETCAPAGDWCAMDDVDARASVAHEH
jgi:cobalt-zinc-cadmium efflux system protein